MNRPAKGFAPAGLLRSQGTPFFALRAQKAGEPAVTRVLEGPLNTADYEGASGSPAPNHGLPRFRRCTFAAAYPLGQVLLADDAVPLDVKLEAFNPLIPGDADRSGIPIAVLRFTLTNHTSRRVSASLCGSLANFIGFDGTQGAPKGNLNAFRQGAGFQGVYMSSQGVEQNTAQWGTMALATTAKKVSARTAWKKMGWGSSMLDFWDDFSSDGQLEEREPEGEDSPMASLTATVRVPARSSRQVTFVLAWHFPNRYTWSPSEDNCCGDEDRIGNYYTTQFADAWDVLEKSIPQLPRLEADTVRFVNTVCASDLPRVVKEAALFNLSTLKTQTCFRTPDGRFFGWEGYTDSEGCCFGSCTHVWNYEQAVAFLFGDLARTMREVEFHHALADDGKMSFRVSLPLDRAKQHGMAAADGQMGCIMKAYREWQHSGDADWLRAILPQVRKALEFCWIDGGWDADRDGVMEGCQHNTMDVEYFGPNPQMGGWYLGALRAAEEMHRHAGEVEFADECRALFERGRRWMDEELFNGEYYEHVVQTPDPDASIAAGLVIGAGSENRTDPDYQLGSGCLVDQLVGQLVAHVCGLGYLFKPEHVRKTLKSILKYNRLEGFHGHVNFMRSYVLGDEAALLMASYPKKRPRNPFPYFTEVMTGFEYTAAIGMLYEGKVKEGLRCIGDIRERYDGRRRSPFDEAECGHHYARAMVSWAAILALTGFSYSAVEQRMTFAANNGANFWSNGSAWGSCKMKRSKRRVRVDLTVECGELALKRFALTSFGEHRFKRKTTLKAGKKLRFVIERG